MSILFRIVYAAHANGTHHKLALDALRGLKCENADGWTRLFLKHADRYMEGSKAPDNAFKDFKNHVLHVGDHYWGGAPEATELWYDKTVAALKAGQWEDAVYAAGVTSHYFTDPMMPFHTGQTEAENAIHRAAEWSINRSYNDLRRLGEQQSSGAAEVRMPDGDDWLKHMVCDGADLSHRYYEKLIAHYDIHRGVTDPPAGLDGVARGFVADLLVRAATGFGLVLDRALTGSGTRPPDVVLTMDTVMAAVRIPAKQLAKRLTNAEDRKVVEAMYDELKSTGRVEKTLPEDLRSVRDQHADEILKPKLAAQALARAERLGSAAIAREIAKAPAPALSSLAGRLSHAAPPRPAPLPTMPMPLPTLSPLPSTSTSPTPSLPLAIVSTSVPSVSPNRDRIPRIYLAANDMLEAAPSIGPKMAERFLTLGIKTVGDFLEADPAKLAARLADRRIGDTTIEDWQCQARLVMEIPGLRGTHAQLLTGAGFRSTAAIAAADAGKLSSDVLRFAGTPDGRRVLRDGDPPDVEKIKGWVDAARIAQAA